MFKRASLTLDTNAIREKTSNWFSGGEKFIFLNEHPVRDIYNQPRCHIIKFIFQCGSGTGVFTLNYLQLQICIS